MRIGTLVLQRIKSNMDVCSDEIFTSDIESIPWDSYSPSDLAEYEANTPSSLESDDFPTVERE